MKTRSKADAPLLEASIPFALAPIALRADEAARVIGATTFFIEELLRSGELPFVVVGKRRVIFIEDLKSWFEQERNRQRRGIQSVAA